MLQYTHVTVRFTLRCIATVWVSGPSAVIPSVRPSVFLRRQGIQRLCGSGFARSRKQSRRLRSVKMADDGAFGTKTSGKGPGTLAVPAVPPDQPLLHDAIRFREKFDDYLAKVKLLAVKNGESSPRVATLVDYPLHELPALNVAAPDYATRLESRLRLNLTLEIWGGRNL